LQDQPSSFEDYLGNRKTEWVHPEEILTFFSKSNSNLSYKSFILENSNEEENTNLEKITLEDETLNYINL
jgi:hypothetical protein